MVKKIKIHPVRQEQQNIPIKSIVVPPGYPEGIPLSEREGVFVHSFKCWHCGLHFNLFSWKPDKHTVDNVYCPECGKKGSFTHHRSTLSESPKFDENSKNEIFKFVPFPGSEKMNDSTYPAGLFQKDDKSGKK